MYEWDLQFKIYSAQQFEKLFIVIVVYSQNCAQKSIERKLPIKNISLYLFLLMMSGLGFEPGLYANTQDHGNSRKF